MSLLAALDRHWFAPGDLRALAATRIVVVSLVLLTLILPGITAWLGIRGSYDWSAQRFFLAFPDEEFRPIPALKLLTAPFGEWGGRPDATFLHVVFWLALLSGGTALLGLATRASTLCFAAAATILTAHGYSYGEMHHPETLPTLALWILPFAPIGGAWSLDAVRDRRRRAARAMRFEPVQRRARLDPLARWPLRTIQWLLVIAYLSAAVEKLEIGGLSWMNGYRLTYSAARELMGSGSALPLVFAAVPAAAPVLAVLTVAFELTFVFALLIPALTIPYLIVGSGMHVGIFVLLGAPFVGWPLLYVAFVDQVRRAAGRRRRAAAAGGRQRREPDRPRWTVLFDGHCPLCLRTMVALDALDVRRRLRFVDFESEGEGLVRSRPDLVPEALRHVMHVLSPEGRVYQGFYAFRALAGPLPALWPLLPLLHTPGASAIGKGVYSLIARKRTRATCRVESCFP